MAKQKLGLGKGLDSLITNSIADHSNDRLVTVNINKIQPGRFQPRIQMNDESLSELADSIKAQGVIQPIIVREHGLSNYELIAGERRWRASQIAGLVEIPVVVKSINDEAALAIGLIENLQRENLNPIEEAKGLKRLADEFSLTHETIAQAVGKSRSAVSNSLRLLSLPEPIQDLLFQRDLEMGHARALLTLPIVDQLTLAKKAANNGWSVREVEKRAQTWFQNQTMPPKKTLDPEIIKLNETLTEKLGTQVEIKTSNKKTGKIVIHFDSPDSFENILKQLHIEEL